MDAREQGAGLLRPAMPRPMLLPALSLAAGICAAELLAEKWVLLGWIVPALPAAGVILVLCGRAGRPRLLAVGVALTALGVGFQRHQVAVSRPADHVSHLLSDEPFLTRISGVIVSTPVARPGEKRNPFLPMEPPARTRFVLAAQRLLTSDPPQRVRGKILVTVEAENLGLRLGDAVELTGKLYRPVGPRNPGEIDWRRWYHLQGIEAGLSVESPGCLRPGVEPAGWLPRLVRTVRSTAQAMLLEPCIEAGQEEEVSRLLDTLVLGQRSAIDRSINEAFLRAGGLHFLAVSGFNVAVLASATWWLARRLLRRSATTTALATLAVVLLYALIAEPNAPILRATICGVLATLAVLTHRPVCSINWLAAAAVCLLLFDPLSLFTASFQLSFVQVLVLVTAVPALYRSVLRWSGGPAADEADTLARLLLRSTWRGIVGLSVVCVVAWAFALPLAAYHFERVAPWGVAGTLLLTIPVTVATWLSFLTLFSNLVFPPAADVLAPALGHMTRLILSVARLFEHLPGAVVDCSAPPAWLVGLTYVVLLAPLVVGVAELGGQGGRRLALLATVGGLVALWVGWIVLPARPTGGACYLHVLAVGNGSATVIVSPEGHAICFDVGTDRNADAGEMLSRAMRRLGLRHLEYVFISHANFDHYSGLPSLLARVPVRRLMFCPQMLAQQEDRLPAATLLERLTHKTAAVAAAGHRFDIGSMRIDVLWPPSELPPGNWSTNDTSLALRLSACGRSVLLPADIGPAAMQALLEQNQAGRIRLSADVLVAPHHGSVSRGPAAAFYEAVNPELVIVSAAERRPGLQALLDQTLGAAVKLLNTAECGAITVRIGPDGLLSVQTYWPCGAIR